MMPNGTLHLSKSPFDIKKGLNVMDYVETK